MNPLMDAGLRTATAAQPGQLPFPDNDPTLGFEVHVAAAQVWLALPGHHECRALYPLHARAFAAALDGTVNERRERRVYVSDGVFYAVEAGGPDRVVVREEEARPGVPPVSATLSADAARQLARRVRLAANRAELGSSAAAA